MMRKPRKTQSEKDTEVLLAMVREDRDSVIRKLEDLDENSRQTIGRLYLKIDELKKSLEESERNLVNAKSELDEARQRLRSESVEKIRLNAEREAYQAVAMQAVTRR